jgi:hypothetical protein
MVKRNEEFPLSSQEPTSSEEDLLNRILSLPTEDRKHLLRRVGALDLSDHLCADVRIYDWGEDETKPRACYVFADGTEDEAIDIIETVRANPLSIADPRVLHAFRRWLFLSRYRAIMRKLKKYTSSRFGEIAANNIEKLYDAFRKSASPLSGDLFEEAVYALGANSFKPLLLNAWELLDTNEVQFVSHGEDEDGKTSKSRRDRTSKLKVLRKRLEQDCYDDTPALKLQKPDVFKQLEMEMQFYGTRIPDVLFMEEGKQPIKVSANHRVIDTPAARRCALLLPISPDEWKWVTIGELMKKCSMRGSKNQLLCLHNLVTRAGYNLSSWRFSSRLRKLAALMGLSEVSLGELQHSDDDPYVFSQQVLYNKITLGNPPDLLNETKVDIVISFLKVIDDKLFSRKPDWETFFKRFVAWLGSTDEGAAKKSRQRAKKQDFEKGRLGFFSYVPPGWLDVDFLLPDVLNEYPFTEIPDWLSMPVQPAKKK